MLTAAAEATARGLARITLLGNPTTVASEGKKLGLDLGGCTVVDPAVSVMWGGGSEDEWISALHKEGIDPSSEMYTSSANAGMVTPATQLFAQTSDRLSVYIELLVEARKSKGMTHERAADLVLGKWGSEVGMG